MEVTEVRIKLMEEAGERLQAFCSVTLDDCFVVRDLKIIEGTNGPFVAMPSRKLTAHCGKCGCKNHLRANYCNDCGQRLSRDLADRDEDGRAKLYADIAHPINSVCREMIQERVIHEFLLERELAQKPGYVSRYDDYDVDFLSTTEVRQRRDAPDDSVPAPSFDRSRASASRPREQGAHVRLPRRQEPPTDKKQGEEEFGAGIF